MKKSKSSSDVFSMRCGGVARKRQLALVPSSEIKELLFTWLDWIGDGTLPSYKVLLKFELERIQHEIDTRKHEIDELEQLLEQKRGEFTELESVLDREAVALDELWESLRVARFELDKIKNLIDIESVLATCLVDNTTCIHYCLNRLEQYRKSLLVSYPRDTKMGRDLQWDCDWLRGKLEYMLTDEYTSKFEY